MAEVDLTATIQGIQDQNPDLELITDQSLNAGSFLPSEPFVDDNRVIEVKVPLAAISDLIPNDEELDANMAATEARFIELSYIREDMVSARGMCKKFASEAIAIKPTFGSNKPISYYSNLPTQTRYTASLEEIDQTIQVDAVGQLGLVRSALHSYMQFPIGALDNQNFSWDRYSNASLSVVGGYIDFKRQLEDEGFEWDDQSIFDAAINPVTLNNVSDVVPFLGQARSLAAKSDFFMVYLDLPVALEMLTMYTKAWNISISNYVEALKDTDSKPPKIEPVENCQVSINGKIVSLKDVAEALEEALLPSVNYDDEPKETLKFLKLLSDAAQVAPIGEVVNRLQQLRAEALVLENSIQSLETYLEDFDKYSEKLTFLTDAIFKISSQIAEVSKMIRACNGWTVTYVNDFINSLHRGARLSECMANVAWVALQQAPELFQTCGERHELLKNWLSVMHDDTESLAS